MERIEKVGASIGNTLNEIITERVEILLMETRRRKKKRDIGRKNDRRSGKKSLMETGRRRRRKEKNRCRGKTELKRQKK